MIMLIGAGTSKFLGVRGIFVRISPNFPESFCATFAYNFSSAKINECHLFGVTSTKRSSFVFLQMLGLIF